MSHKLVKMKKLFIALSSVLFIALFTMCASSKKNVGDMTKIDQETKG